MIDTLAFGVILFESASAVAYASALASASALVVASGSENASAFASTFIRYIFLHLTSTWTFIKL